MTRANCPSRWPCCPPARVDRLVILGSLVEAALHFLEQKRLLCHEFFTPLTIGRLYPESLLYLLEHPLFWLGLMGTVWVLKKEGVSIAVRLWIWNFILWCLVYLTAVYWHRFALPALFLAAPLAAHFPLAASGRLTAHFSPRPAVWLSGGLVLAILIVLYPWSGLDYLEGVINVGTSPPEKLVKFLQTNVPRHWLIETPEYELVFLNDDHRIHLIPSYFL